MQFVEMAKAITGLKRIRFRRLLAAFAILAVLLAASSIWLFTTGSGLRVLVGTAEYFSGGVLRAEGVRGTLRGPLSIASLNLDLPGAKLELAGVALDWQPSALFSRELALTRLRVDRVDVFLQETEATPPSGSPALPESLRLPLDFDLEAEIGGLRIYGADTTGDSRSAPLFALSEGRLSLRGEPERFHLRQLAANLPEGRAEAEGELGTAAPYALRASGHLNTRAFTAEFDGEGGLAEFALRLRAQGKGAQGRATVAATLFSPSPLKTLELDAEGVDPSAFASGLPRADLRLHAGLAATDDAEKPGLKGSVHIGNKRPAALDAGGLPVSSLDAEIYAGAALDELRLDSIVLDVGGKLTGWLHWRKEAGQGGEEASGESEAGAVLPAGFGRVDADLQAAAFDPSRFDSRLPSRRVDARLEAVATAQRQHGKLSLRTGAAQLEGEGEVVASAVNEPVFVLSLDLRDFDPSVFHSGSPSASIGLRASATGTLAAKPLVAVHYVFGENSCFNGKPLGGNGLFTWDGARARNADLGFDFAGNRVKFAGAWGGTDDRLTLDIDAPRLATVGYGLEGHLRANGHITGGLDAPAGVLRIDAEKLRLPGVLEIVALSGDVRVDAGDAGPLALSLKASGLAAGDVRIASAALVAEGRRDQHRIRTETDGKLGEDAVTLAATLEGGLKEGRWQGRIAALESGGRWPLRLRAPTALELGGRSGSEGFSLVGAEFDVGEKGRLSLDETRWEGETGVAVLRGSLSGFPAAMLPWMEQRGRRDPLILGSAWNLRIGETIEGDARLFRESGDFTARGEISTRIGLERFETYLLARNRKLMLVLAAHGRETGELGLSLEAGIERAGQGWRLAPQVPLAGAAHLDMPSIAWLGRMLRENVELGGGLAADISFAGTPDAPDLQGRIAGHALQLAFVDQGLLLAGGELEAGFAHRDGRQSLHLARLEFESANRVKPGDKRLPFDELTASPGRLRVTGNIDLGATSSLESAQRGQFEFTAERLPLLQRVDRWLIVSGQGHARLQGKALDVDAQLHADAGYIEIDDTPPPSLGDDVVVRGKGGAGAAPEPEAGEGLAIGGKIAVDLGQALYLAAFGVDTRLAGKLDVELRPFESPSVLGMIRTAGGSYRGYGQRLAIERGTITFQGDPGNPALNIVAMRRGMEIDSGVAITGTAHHPQVKLVSEPAVPDHEKLSWLVLGRAPDAGGSDLALLVPAAQALFGGPGGGMGEDLARKLGFDSFSIGQGELNSNRRSATSKVVGGGSRISAGPAVSGDVVSVGKRITNDLSLSFEQSLGGAESLVKLTYRLGRRLSLVARGGTDNALDVYYTFSFRDREKRKSLNAEQSTTEASE